PMGSSSMIASEPPATMRSASPRWMIRKASPIAWLPVAQAVTTDEFGPLSLYRMESCPEAMLTISDGTKNGETRLGPFSRRTLCHSRMERMPPIPEPTRAPARVGSTWEKSILALSTASTPATIAYWMKRSSFFSSFFSITFRGSKPLTSAAMRQSRRLGSNRVIVPTPDRPSQMARQYSGTELPRGVTAPSPVTTTRVLPPSASIAPPPPSVSPRAPQGLRVFLDVLDRVTHRCDLLSVLVRDLDV